MRLNMFCKPCFFLNGKPDFMALEPRDDGLYTFNCSQGHKNTEILLQDHFEILAEIASYAILDGYYREAVSSFSASLERFYEFAVHVLLRQQGLTSQLFESTWKPISKQSERQLGAFVLTWALAYGATPRLLPEGETGRNFRNDVTHKGKIPSRAEAIAYGELVLGLIREQMSQLHAKASEAIKQVSAYREENLLKAAGGNPSIGSSRFMTILSLSSGSGHEISIPEYLSILEGMRHTGWDDNND